MRTYLNKIDFLDDNQIFTFGSNPLGINGSINTGKGGSALFALRKGWVLQGEKMNNCLSLTGKSWGIVTVVGPGKRRSKTPEQIIQNIQILYNYAIKNPDKYFLIAYTGLNEYNLNGYSNNELGKMFSYTGEIPDNIIFEKSFSTLL
jgi:hypothetical protein